MLAVLFPITFLLAAQKNDLAFRGDVLAVRTTLHDCTRVKRAVVDQTRCYERAIPYLEEILADYYAERKASLESTRVERLDRAQLAWEHLRDVECDHPDHAATSEERLIALICRWDETHARLFELEKRTRKYEY